MTTPSWPPQACWTREALEGTHARLCAAERRVPQDPRIVALRGEIAMHLRRWREAEQCFETFARRTGHTDLAKYHLALLDFYRGDWRHAWKRYEARIAIDFPADYRGLATTVWNGDPIDGRRILLVPEQGIGDTIQLLRFLPELRRRAARVRILARGVHTRLLEAFIEAELLTTDDADGDIALFTYSLPLALGKTAPADVEHLVPYLRADPGRVARWRERFAGLSGRRAAVVWAGNPASANDWNRSLPPRLLAPLAQVPGTSLIDFQYDAGRFPATGQDRALFAARVSRGIGPWAECAAALSACDLLIAVDTSAAHLAGALGVPVWLLLSWNADHRWGTEGTETPWYPKHRLFRAKEPGAWESAIEAAVAALRNGERIFP